MSNDKLDDRENLKVGNGNMRFDAQADLLRESSGGKIPVDLVDGGMGEIIVSGEAGVKPVLRHKAIYH